MLEKPEHAVKMFRLVLAKLVDAKWRRATEAGDILGQYIMFLSDAKQFNYKNFLGIRLDDDRLDSFLFEVSHAEKAYEELWNTLKILLTLSHGKAAIESGFSANKEVLLPNLKEVNMTKIHLIHDYIWARKARISDFVITEDLLSSCNLASNKYKTTTRQE